MTTVNDVMSSEMVTATPNESAETVRELLRDLGVGSAVVIEDGALAGVVTRSDLLVALADEPIGALMAEEVVTVAPETAVEQAARAMRRHGVHHLVVVAPGGSAAVGVVSSWDLLESLAELVDTALAGELRPHSVSPGDHLEVRGPDGGRRGTVTEVRGRAGLPPWQVVWDDDPRAHEVVIVPGEPIALDGCER